MEYLAAIIIGLVLMEVSDRKNQIVQLSVSLAVRLLPYDKKKRARYQEEWEADALAAPGRLSSILRALGCFGAAGSILGHEKTTALKAKHTSVRLKKAEFPHDKVDIFEKEDPLEIIATLVDSKLSFKRVHRLKTRNQLAHDNAFSVGYRAGLKAGRAKGFNMNQLNK